MRRLVFEGKSWLAYEKLREQDKKKHAALVKLIREKLRDDPATGSGKPEQLRNQLSGLWSKRISQKDRLVYSFDDDHIYIYAIGGYYDQYR